MRQAQANESERTQRKTASAIRSRSIRGQHPAFGPELCSLAFCVRWVRACAVFAPRLEVARSDRRAARSRCHQADAAVFTQRSGVAAFSPVPELCSLTFCVRWVRASPVFAPRFRRNDCPRERWSHRVRPRAASVRTPRASTPASRPRGVRENQRAAQRAPPSVRISSRSRATSGGFALRGVRATSSWRSDDRASM